jgi:hypothetical protein
VYNPSSEGMVVRSRSLFFSGVMQPVAAGPRQG